ncbi:MAG: 1,4-dihydroxy-6-naphthoate synthase [Rikenellaceae bacterium]|nr:1,4-dihydroxy-6-naphthoate synthase [Rikenellaceae bacterium]
MRLTLNISPCPNDTFMFDAIVNCRIDIAPFEFDVRYLDIEQLNAAVLEGGPAISKISYAVLPAITERYRVLDSGSALGRGNGPLLVSRGKVNPHEAGLRVAVPGMHTTANALMRKLFPQVTDKVPMLFSDIAEAVERGAVDAGVLIHEGRFTYAARGLQLVADLGVEWERATGLPLPLGAIVADRSLPAEVFAAFEELLRRSIEYAFANPMASREYVKEHARELADDVIESHINLFVNQFSLSLGSEGRRAVTELTGLVGF